jgi:hypothetical protein
MNKRLISRLTPIVEKWRKNGELREKNGALLDVKIVQDECSIYRSRRGMGQQYWASL